jgi:hypothetical protein
MIVAYYVVINTYLHWLASHTSLISALASLLMLIVWVFYAHLLYRQFRNQHHPRLMIHQAPNMAKDSLCLLINMSERLINVVSIIVYGFAHNQEVCMEITDYMKLKESDEINEELKTDIRSLLKQGPLATGEFIVVGQFDGIIENLSTKLVEKDKEFPYFHRLEVRVIVFHGRENRPIGAYRGFQIEKGASDKIRIKPSALHTKQMISFWQRKKVNTWIKTCVEDS